MSSQINRGCIGLSQCTPNIERLRATLEAVKRDKSHFNQKLWVSFPNSKKYPESCGCYAWFAVELYGTPEQKKKFTWDKAHDWVGPKILELNRKLTATLFWGGNTVEMIEKIIDGWVAEAGEDD